MGCSGCSTGTNGSPKGCKNNGSCGTDSCNKLAVFDWLSNMTLPNGQDVFKCVEVRFKNGRKDFYNRGKYRLQMGDVVAVEVPAGGHDVGVVSLAGELVRVQMKKKKVNPEGDDLKKIYRIASQEDIDKWQGCRDKEESIKVRSREIARDLKLEMKISDIEYQGDGSKITFYYTAMDRVDFRQLIKEFASTFRARIEMKQIGFRQEAARLGGVGSCGRELCCSTWLTDFRSVNTASARYQQLSLNPQKLAGQCGKLKCCLNYELDAYLDSLKEFPSTDQRLHTDKGTAVCQKIDIFKGRLWFSYIDGGMQWHELTLEQVHEIIETNQGGEKIESLEEYASDLVSEKIVDFENVVGQDSLTRFDQPKRRKNNRRKKKKTTSSKGSKVEGRQKRDAKPNAKNNRGNQTNRNQDSKDKKSGNSNSKRTRPNNNSENKSKKEGSSNPKPNNRRQANKSNKNTVDSGSKKQGNKTMGNQEAKKNSYASKPKKRNNRSGNRRPPNKPNNES